MIEYIDNLWSWQGISSLVIIAALFLSYLIIRVSVNLNSLSTSKSVKIARIKLLFADMLISISIIMLIVNLCLTFNNPDWRFMVDLFVLIFLVWQVVVLVKINRLLFIPINEVIALSFELQFEKQSEQKNIPKALESIKAACEIDPEGPQHWLRRSIYEEDTKKAKEYISHAEKLSTKVWLESKAFLSLLEYCKGVHILKEQGDNKLALKHLRQSLELCYEEGCEKLIQKIDDVKGE